MMTIIIMIKTMIMTTMIMTMTMMEIITTMMKMMAILIIMFHETEVNVHDSVHSANHINKIVYNMVIWNVVCDCQGHSHTGGGTFSLYFPTKLPAGS